MRLPRHLRCPAAPATAAVAPAGTCGACDRHLRQPGHLRHLRLLRQPQHLRPLQHPRQLSHVRSPRQLWHLRQPRHVRGRSRHPGQLRRLGGTCSTCGICETSAAPAAVRGSWVRRGSRSTCGSCGRILKETCVYTHRLGWGEENICVSEIKISVGLPTRQAALNVKEQVVLAAVLFRALHLRTVLVLVLTVARVCWW